MKQSVIKIITLILLLSCGQTKTNLFIIDFYSTEDIHERVLNTIEKYGYQRKMIGGVKTPKIQISKNEEGKLLNKLSSYESKESYIDVLTLFPSMKTSINIMLKDKSYKYSEKDLSFLNYFCELAKENIRENTELMFIDYKPGDEMPSCKNLLLDGLAEFKNVNH